MDYRVFVVSDCPGCERVIEWLAEHTTVTCEVINIQTDAGRPPHHLAIFPALFAGDRLLAYGDDIMKRLAKAA